MIIASDIVAVTSYIALVLITKCVVWVDGACVGQSSWLSVLIYGHFLARLVAWLFTTPQFDALSATVLGWFSVADDINLASIHHGRL